ncbi:MAG: type II toxin-antitoxin system PemK/MazF family toxin [Saprospiraceae bacterium]|nr:type II toxin-antitoxin system PemK/MazF family toxin [Candidatus Vicinibacter proximus]MBL7822580.1 type II toxin-antitoxin system PemK/MazF family toxin [Saprospiraceae bacterium]MCC6841558.1 type II toxin-antitoxin system PemK/MazF family toxin [Saprospiraceae bacterium]
MKDFDSWNREKKNLENIGHATLSFHEREIWWCSIGLNLGDEQDGKNELFERPVLIIKKFNNKICWVLPMTTKQKDGIYYHQLEHDGKIFSVILSQIRLVSVKRFRRFIRKISPHQFEKIQNKLASFLKKEA